MALSRKTGWIGIDLETRTLRLAQVKRLRNGLRIVASAVVPRIRTVNGEGDAVAKHSEWTSQQLQAALSLHAGFAGRTAACVLPMCLADLNVLSLPPGGIVERRAMVAHELSSMFAQDEREREFSFWNWNSATTLNASDMEDVNVLSVPRKLVSRVADNFSAARLTCKVIDGLPFALARAVELASAPGLTAPVGAVDWGFACATFCVVSGGKPLFTRHLRHCGASLLVKAVSDELSLSEDEAVQVLLAYGLPDHEGEDHKRREIQEVIAEVAGHHLNEMSEELKRTISYLQMQYPGILPKQLCFFGDGATVKGVTPFLSEKVGIPTDVWRLPHSEYRAREASQDHPALLGTAVALSTLAWAS